MPLRNSPSRITVFFFFFRLEALYRTLAGRKRVPSHPGASALSRFRVSIIVARRSRTAERDATDKGLGPGGLTLLHHDRPATTQYY